MQCDFEERISLPGDFAIALVKALTVYTHHNKLLLLKHFSTCEHPKDCSAQFTSPNIISYNLHTTSEYAKY